MSNNFEIIYNTLDKLQKTAEAVLKRYQLNGEQNGWSPKDDCSDFQYLAKFFEIEELL